MERLIQVILASKPTLDADTLLHSKDLYGEGVIDSFDILVLIDELAAEYRLDIGAADFSREDFMCVESIGEMVKRFGGTYPRD